MFVVHRLDIHDWTWDRITRTKIPDDPYVTVTTLGHLAKRSAHICVDRNRRCIGESVYISGVHSLQVSALGEVLIHSHNYN